MKAQTKLTAKQRAMLMAEKKKVEGQLKKIKQEGGLTERVDAVLKDVKRELSGEPTVGRPRFPQVSDADRHRLRQAEDLIRKAGYVETSPGSKKFIAR